MFCKNIKSCIKSSKLLLRTYSAVSDSVIVKRNNTPSAYSVTSLVKSDNELTVPTTPKDLTHTNVRSEIIPVFASYINQSPFLQDLFKLGVDLHKIEKDEEAVKFLLQLNFESIKEHIIFLRGLQIEQDKIGFIITKNPYILKEDLEDLRVRINYLESKGFDVAMISRIVQTNPFWLSHRTQKIDNRLGFLQNHFKLTGEEVRHLVWKNPKLVTYPTEKIKLNAFVLTEEMGFTKDELKKIIFDIPKILMNEQNRTLQSFEYLHQTMKVSLERIVETPGVLTCRKKRLMQRHQFLLKLDRAQYNPKKPNYVALTSLVSGSDSYFSTEIAKSSVQLFNVFLKTL